MEALSTGLINEMLDLKSNFRMMSREAGERSRQHPEPVSIIRDRRLQRWQIRPQRCPFPTHLAAAP